jgi:hypothetical protein
VVRPHLLTTAIGHGAIAADGIDRFLRKRSLEKRPKIDVHTFDLKRKMIEKGVKLQRRCKDARSEAPMQEHRAVHNFDNRSDRYVIPHKELFLGHFQYTARNKRHITR